MTSFPSDLPIVDAHQHLWDLEANYYPWLTDRVEKRVCGEYSAIRKNYLLGDFLDDIGELPLTASVHVEAVIDRGDPVRETAWLQRVAEGGAGENPRGLPNGVVVFCDLASPEAPAMLQRHMAHRNVRGVRQMLHEELVDPDNPRPPLYEDATWRANLRLLAHHGLTFDLQLYPEQMEAGHRVARENPEIQFVLCHTGQPLLRTPEGIAGWRAGLARMASLDNVAVKISGLGMFDRTWTVETIRPFVLGAIEAFGTRRAMFGSNFPVDGMFSPYRRLWEAYEAITRDFSQDERRRLFAGNAIATYRLAPVAAAAGAR